MNAARPIPQASHLSLLSTARRSGQCDFLTSSMNATVTCQDGPDRRTTGRTVPQCDFFVCLDFEKMGEKVTSNTIVHCSTFHLFMLNIILL